MRLLFFLLLLFSTAEAGEIVDTITVSRSVLPDVYVVPLTVKVRALSEESVLKVLGTVDTYLRELKLPYDGGNYVVRERREWNPVKKRYVFEGFEGSAYYVFKLKEVSRQSEILKALKRAKEQVDFRYSVSSPHWEISKLLRQQVTAVLKKEILIKAKSEAGDFGKLLGKSCSVEFVGFQPRRLPFPIVKSAVRAESIAPEPPKREREITLRAEVKFKCR